MFYIGQKVVFVGRGDFARAKQHEPWLVCPIKGPIYTVRELTYFDEPGLRVEEIVNPPGNYDEGHIEASWRRDEFRPLTDISVFTKMLEKEPA